MLYGGYMQIVYFDYLFSDVVAIQYRDNYICGEYMIMLLHVLSLLVFNTLRPRQMTAISKCIFLNKTVYIYLKISLKCVLNHIPALGHMIAWRRLGDKPLSEPMMVI